MIIADWVALALVLVVGVVGALVGFGRGLEVLTSGIVGILISIFICYSLGGLIMDLGFVKELMNKFVIALANKHNGFCNFLIKIHIEVVVFYIVLLIVVQLARWLLTKLVRAILEINNIVFKVFNKILGVILFLAVFILIVLFVFQIIAWIGGSTAYNFALKLNGSKFGIDKLFLNNPLMSLKERFTYAVN
ncbi:MAG: hypothetical protein K2K60_06390 [Clostridia bacterium]|nr:hypothetical protein [Clostridia bacterium]